MTISGHLRPFAAAVLLAAGMPGAAYGADTVKHFPRTDDLPFSEAVQAGNVLHMTMQLGLGPDGSVVAGGFAPELRRAMENIGALLRKHGLAYDALIKCHIALLDMNNYDTLNQIYGSFFQKGHYPARATMAVTRLARGASVGVECIAWNPSGR